ncbi:MAG: hypothetical protein AB1668_05245 [Nanoarchaeota archaeon]
MPAILSVGAYSGRAEEWVNDLRSVVQAGDFPQAMLIDVHEFGNYRDFISKMNERLCGQAQWETMNQTRITLENYLRQAKATNLEVYAELEPYSHGPRCKVPNTKCASPCQFGSKLGLERLI